ncbi:MAG: hypothetical protein GXY84_03835 [Clostridiales bacterium]|nr:hypothetical protein [Clostridiales bacterium]
MSPLPQILVIALVTAALRLLPVLLLGGRDRGLPPTLLRLSQSLPGAIIGFLVVYSLRDLAFTALSGWLPALLGVLVAGLLQHYRKNTLLSVFSATAAYMALLQVLA